MQAIRIDAFGGPDVLRLTEIADPSIGPGQVLVRIEAAGVNPVDTYIRSGVYTLLPELPYTPGADGAGVVEALGEGVDHIKVGQRVYIAGVVGGLMNGTYAELAVRPGAAVFPLPAKTSFSEGAAIGVPYGTAARALFQRGRAQPWETVFIHGASGSVGTGAIQLARAFGLEVIGSAGSEAGLELVRDQGAHHALDHREEGYLDRLAELTGGNGPDLILEMLANVNLERDMQIVARRGRIVIIGSRGTIQVTPRHAMTREIDVRGLALWNCTAAELKSIHAGLVAGLESGTLRPVIRAELPLGEAAAAHAMVLEPGALGKIVLVP